MDKEDTSAPKAGGLKFDEGKPMLALLPAVGLTLVGEVLTYGATKYCPDNWRKGLLYSRLLSATLRHIFAFLRGQTLDMESGLPHLAHAATNLLFILEFHHTPQRAGDDRPWDDRYKG